MEEIMNDIKKFLRTYGGAIIGALIAILILSISFYFYRKFFHLRKEIKNNKINKKNINPKKVKKRFRNKQKTTKHK